ncbi:MAG TPA: trypsin-like peptidase domain-containing protein [Candidatus Acidoferrum sp.]|nr:trypsin-like peptidase domain-containing protein [Candidatus Acidoferrum sp.]
MNRSKAAVFLALVAAFIAGCIVPGRKADPPAPAGQAESPGLSMARQLNEAFVSVAQQVSPSVVVLEVTEKPARGRRGGLRPRAMGEGSGIILTKDGYILTNHHIVDNADKIKVYLRDGHSFDAEVRGSDPKTDIAVVKIKPVGVDLQAAKLGDSDKLRVGEFVVAIGHPLELTYSVTVGHVSAVARQLSTDSYANTTDYQEYIQTDAVINPGNSGGPLINLNGEVIAVNAMMEGSYDPISGFTQNRGIGLAIPINEARVVKDRLIRDGKFTRSIIGIGMARDVRGMLDVLTQEGLGEGVRVASLIQNGPAEKAGLKTNDLIVAVDGLPVKTARDFANTVSLKRPGQSITISVKRDNSNQPLPFKVVTQADAPPEESLVSISSGRPRTPARTSESDYGFTAKALTTDLARQFGVDDTTGVIVTDVKTYSQALTDVAPYSQAYRRGIEPGDIILKMNNKPISTIEQFDQALKAVAPGESLTMELKTKNGPEFKVLRAPASE